jgi:hypothetical protein
VKFAAKFMTGDGMKKPPPPCYPNSSAPQGSNPRLAKTHPHAAGVRAGSKSWKSCGNNVCRTLVFITSLALAAFDSPESLHISAPTRSRIMIPRLGMHVSWNPCPCWLARPQKPWFTSGCAHFKRVPHKIIRGQWISWNLKGYITSLRWKIVGKQSLTTNFHLFYKEIPNSPSAF